MEMEFLNVFLDILATPAILVGVFALIGLLLQKKEVSQVISGTLKTVLGFILITAGGNVIISSLDVFGKMFNRAFSISGVIPNNEAIVAVAQSTFGTQTALIMVFGMVMNLVLARFTPLKFVFLTGHHTLFMACLIAVILSTAGLKGALLVIVGSVILGILMVVSPAILFPYVRKITGSDDFAVGHFGSVGYLVAGAVGKWTGDPSKSTESIKVPKQLGFLRDTSVAVSLTMAILFIVVALFTGSGYIESQLSDGQNYLVYSLIQAVTFAAGVYVVLAGVRMLIGEIVPAFKGFAEKLVPDAKPALDCPTVFPFAPNAVIIGFLSSFVAGLVSMFVLPLFGLRVIVPGLVPHFFTGATAGVFGNATGGRRGAILGAFANGLINSFLPALLLPALGDLGFRETTFGDADFGVVGLILSFLADFFS